MAPIHMVPHHINFAIVCALVPSKEFKMKIK